MRPMGCASVSRNERTGIGCPFGVAAGEVDTADDAVTRMRSECRSRVIECWVKDILSMFPVAQAVVDDQGDDHISCDRFSIGDIFAPERAPGPMAIHALARIAVIGPPMSKVACKLIGYTSSLCE